MENAGIRSPYVGSPEPNRRGFAQASGQVRYADDIVLPGQLYAQFVRSPHASAKIKSVDLSGTRRMHGVVAAMDGEEVARLMGPIMPAFDAALVGGKAVDLYSLARDHVMFEGQMVAVVVAEDKDTAAQAVAAIKVDYDVLPPVIDVNEAAAPDAPRVVPEWDSNVWIAAPMTDGDCDQAFATAAHVIEADISIHRHSAQPMETRAYNAIWDEEDGMVTLYATTQAPHSLRHNLSVTLGLAENRVRVIAPLNGGAFGLKTHCHPEEPLLCLLAMRIKRPVKWVETREECLMIGAREQQHSIALALDENGRLLGVRDHFRANVGAPAPNLGWPMAYTSMITLPGAYDVSNIDFHLEIVVTNKAPWNAYRGYGKEAANYAIEFALDKAARRIGIDPVELRMRNFIPSDQFPSQRPTGLIFDSGDYVGSLAKAAQAANYETLRAKQKQWRAEGRHIGIGVAYEVVPEGGSLPGSLLFSYDSSTVRLDASGEVTVSTGVTDPGTGNATGIAQMVADVFGIAIEKVRVVQGDTERSPFGGGNFSSRSLVLGGAAAVMASRQILEMLGKVAANLLGVSADAVRFSDGFFATGTSNETVTLREVCWAAYTHNNDPIGSVITPPIEVTATTRCDDLRHTPDEKGRRSTFNTFSNGAFIVTIELDPETGHVEILDVTATHDCGKAINPLLVEGQMYGGLAMAIGGMLSEEQCYSESGHMLTRDFADYVMPRALDMPPVTFLHHNVPSPHTPHGAKGAGESCVGGAAIALVNAVNDALAPFGAEISSFPITAPNIWHALQKAKGSNRAEGRERP